MTDNRTGKGPGRRRREDIPAEEIRSMREEGYSWGRISRILDIPKTTIYEKMRRLEE